MNQDLNFNIFNENLNNIPNNNIYKTPIYKDVHIRIQPRGSNRYITIVEFLAEDLDLKKICKAFKKNFNCNGAIAKDDEIGEVIQVSGDQRENIKKFLIEEEIISEKQIIVHGNIT